MHAADRGETGSAPELGWVPVTAGVEAFEEIAESDEPSGTPCGFASSFFHMKTPRHRKLDFRSRLSQGWLGAATRKSEHSTRLSSCKQEWRVASVGGFLKGYTRYSVYRATRPTTDCDVLRVFFLPRNSQTAIAIP